MSKARRVPDFERTATMVDLVHRLYSDSGRAMSLSHVVIEECAPGTGFRHANRYADILALSVWPSNGLTLDGFEVKASRADLKKELTDPAKHEAVARYCDTWTLVAWDETVLVDDIPESWGIVLTRDGDHGRELFTQRKPTKRKPDEWPRTFVCALVRNASEQSPGAAYIARACLEAGRKGKEEGGDIEKSRGRAAIAPLARIIYGENTWRWPKEASDPEHVCKLAAERLTQIPLPLAREA